VIIEKNTRDKRKQRNENKLNYDNKRVKSQKKTVHIEPSVFFCKKFDVSRREISMLNVGSKFFIHAFKKYTVVL
jgi:hypothetical protein